MSKAAAQAERLRQKLTEARKLLGRPLMEAFAAAVRAEIDRSFRTGTSPFGKKWDPTKRGNSPLRGTGQLAASFVVEVVDDTSIVVRSSNPLSRILQGRVRRGGIRLPARIMVPANGRIGRRWVAVLQRAADAAIAAATEAAK